MAAPLVEELANAFIKGLFGILGAVYGASNIDLLQGSIANIYSKTTLKNVCIFYLTGIPGKTNPNVVNTNAWLKCGDQESLIGSWLNVGTGTDLVVSDPQGRINDITINYQATNKNTWPFPGEPNIFGGAYSQSHDNGGLLFGACVQQSEEQTIWVKDCKGHLVIVNVCASGFADGSYGTIDNQNIIDHGWGYFMALPQKGAPPISLDPECP